MSDECHRLKYMSLAQSIGAVLRQARTNQNLSQIDLAAAVDMERSTISAIENGRQNISMQNFVRLCTGLSSDPAKILEKALRMKEKGV